MSREDAFNLRFQNKFDAREGADSNVVPANVLSQALEGLQRIVHLVAMMRGGREVQSRARVTRDIEQRFQLLCDIPQSGSYYQPTFIFSESAEPVLDFAEVEQEESQRGVAETAYEIFQAVQVGDEALFKKAIPDSAYRRPIATAVERMLPQRGTVSLSIEKEDGNVVLQQSRARQFLRQLHSPTDEPLAPATVLTGYLTKVDFRERKMFLQVPDTQKVIPCNYDERAENVILSAPRELIQVVGTVELDENGSPVRITDVEEVFAIDDDDIDIVTLLPPFVKSKSSNEIVVEVELSDDKQSYTARFSPLGIEIAALTREDLVESLRTEIEFIWEEFAQEEHGNLAPSGIELKKRALDLFEGMSSEP